MHQLDHSTLVEGTPHSTCAEHLSSNLSMQVMENIFLSIRDRNGSL